MARVDWINWKTDPKDIINPEHIQEEIDNRFQEYKKDIYLGIYETLKEEMTSGGLDLLSFNIFGSHPANDKANEIIYKIDNINKKMEIIKKQVYQESLKQKQIEKTQLVSCLEEKILEEEKVLDTMIKLGERAYNNETIIDFDEIESITKDTIEKISYLNERLEIAKNI